MPDQSDPIRDIVYGITNLAKALDSISESNQRDHRHLLEALLDMNVEVQRLPNELRTVLWESERRRAETPHDGVPTMPLLTSDSAKAFAQQIAEAEQGMIAKTKSNDSAFIFEIKKSWVNSIWFKLLAATGFGALLMKVLQVLHLIK